MVVVSGHLRHLCLQINYKSLGEDDFGKTCVGGGHDSVHTEGVCNPAAKDAAVIYGSGSLQDR